METLFFSARICPSTTYFDRNNLWKATINESHWFRSEEEHGHFIKSYPET